MNSRENDVNDKDTMRICLQLVSTTQHHCFRYHGHYLCFAQFTTRKKKKSSLPINLTYMRLSFGFTCILQQSFATNFSHKRINRSTNGHSNLERKWNGSNRIQHNYLTIIYGKVCQAAWAEWGPNKNEQYVAIITIQKKYAIKLLLLTNLLQRNKDFSSFIPQNLDDIRIFPPSSLTVQRQQVATITYSVMHRFIQRHRFLPINFNIHAWHTPLT